MDLTTPIDIQAVIAAVREHRDLLVTLDAEKASDILKHFTAIPGVKDSLTLGRTSLGKISHKYTGDFLGQLESGKIKPRTLVVYPCVMEMEDEPERYRRAYITDVKGGLDPNSHPFEIWLNNWGIKSASKELHDVVLTAKYDSDPTKTSLKDSFDGPLSVIQKGILDGEISSSKGNLYTKMATLTVANIGTELLKMYRSLPSTLRNQGVKLHMSLDLGDMYDDWLDAQGVLVTGSGAETAGQQFLRNSQGKCEIVRMPGMPEGSQFVWITIKENQVYGYDKESDMSTIVPFFKGNPYKYTAAGKFVLGFQFVSFDKSIFLCNNAVVTPVQYAFESYASDGTTKIGEGTVDVLAQGDGKSTVKVLTNDPDDPEFVGQTYVVNIYEAEEGTLYPLYKVDGTDTGIKVKISAID